MIKENNKEQNNIVIGIEGLVGSGKTSICKELLNKIPNSILIHGGNIYRGVVYALMSKYSGAGDLDKLKTMLKSSEQKLDIKALMDKLNVEFKLEERETVVYIDGKKVEDEVLQSDKASLAVSMTAKEADNTSFYLFARNIINKYVKQYNVIMSGRAIMQIYPNTDYHFLITADLDERVRRKSKQYGNEIPFEELKKHIIERDKLQEASGFYKQYDQTKIIDVTYCKNVLESTQLVLEQIKIPQALTV